MERPKLLLPWLGTTVVDRVLNAWRRSAVDHILVVARRDDLTVQQAASGDRTTIVRPAVDPPDMKASVLEALRYIEAQGSPAPTDAWLLAPADLPFLSPHVIDQLLSVHARTVSSILVPVMAGHRGHPVLLPWSLADAARELGPQQGIRDLLAIHPWQPIDVDPSFYLRSIAAYPGIKRQAPASPASEPADARGEDERAAALWRFRCDLDTPEQYLAALHAASPAIHPDGPAAP